MLSTAANRPHWTTRLAFILAAAGSAIGLGNIWKFPYIAGVNGGGAFVLVYLGCIALVGLPILVAEMAIGASAQSNAVAAFSATHRPKSPWRAAGWLGVVSAFLILSFYSVVGGWVLDFVFRSVSDQFAGHSDEEIKGVLGTLFSDPVRQLMWHAIFMAATVAIVANGLKKGIERWNEILMPGLLVILVLLVGRAVFLEGFGDAVVFLFAPDASQLTGAGILEAVGHSFFTLSLGMGAMITYGSYLSSGTRLVRTALAVAVMDTVIALVAGVVIFSVVFTFGLEPAGGPTLMFQTLPMLFTRMTGGYLVSIGFFVLVAFAALTSAVSLLEVAVAYWVESHQKDRKTTTLVIGGIIYAVGVLSALSTNLLADVKFAGMTFFDIFDVTTSRVLLPFGGLVISLFFGWVLGPKFVRGVVGDHRGTLAQALLWSARVIAPVGVGIVLINGLWEWLAK